MRRAHAAGEGEDGKGEGGSHQRDVKANCKDEHRSSRSPAELLDEIAKWGRVIAAAKLKPE
jgi:hypothetical protein